MIGNRSAVIPGLSLSINPEREVGTTKSPKGSKEEGLGESCDRAKERGRTCPRILPLSTISIVSLSPILDFGFKGGGKQNGDPQAAVR
jgi:hypothetical protein